jgi:hypothetical protein
MTGPSFPTPAAQNTTHPSSLSHTQQEWDRFFDAMMQEPIHVEPDKLHDECMFPRPTYQSVHLQANHDTLRGSSFPIPLQSPHPSVQLFYVPFIQDTSEPTVGSPFYVLSFAPCSYRLSGVNPGVYPCHSLLAAHAGHSIHLSLSHLHLHWWTTLTPPGRLVTTILSLSYTAHPHTLSHYSLLLVSALPLSPAQGSCMVSTHQISLSGISLMITLINNCYRLPFVVILTPILVK